MKNLLLGALLLLTACAGLFPNPLTPSNLDTLNASWGAALALAANYRDACASRAIPSSCRPIVRKLQIAAAPVQATVKKANSLGATIDTAEIVETAFGMVGSFRALQAQYGVQ